MVTLERLAEPDRPLLENLTQLYMYDWSELIELEVDARGRFGPYPLDPYFTDASRHPFLIRDGAAIAGFALLCSQSRLTGRAGVYDVAEFFVLRRHRRRGVGREAARALLSQFHGPWEVRQRAGNPAATAFWRAVIGELTSGAFEEVAWSDDRGPGVLQRFTST
jgi:predicted acetyltransferase